MEITNIYILIDPRTNMVRYVGKANNVTQRYRAHLNRARKHQIHKKNWIEQLKRLGLKPIIEIVDEVPINEWMFWETYWIWGSILEAEKETNSLSSKIVCCCKGTRKTHNGFKWEYN
jgi:hypothetical protein